MAHSLRLRIAVAFAITCIAVVTALGITLYTASEELEEALVEQIVSEEVDYLIQRHRADPAYRPVAGSSLEYYIVRAPDELAQLPEPLRTLPPGNHEVGRGSDERHVAVREAGGARFIVVYDIGPHELREQQFERLLLLAFATLVVAAFAIGYWLAGVLTRQLTDLAGRVARLAPDAARDTLARPDQDEEVAALARALDDYRHRSEQALRREQEFTANASHELRTPLTGIKTSCELLAAEPALSSKGRDRVAAIARASDHMAAQIHLLLYLARAQASTQSETVALRECVQDAAEPFREAIARKRLEFRVDVAPDAVLDLDRQALHLVLTNLIRNAVQNTERGFVQVSYTPRRLTVADSGSGIAPERLQHVFERFYRGASGSEGLGLGLAIVKRICDQARWNVEVESTVATGTSFSITFPRPD
jgi:signal transduction histidine kinase